MKMIAAVGRDFEIGKDGGLPWSCPADLALFKELTTNSTVVMGVNTALSLRKPLPNRRNVMLLRNLRRHVPFGFDISSVDEVLKDYPDCWIIGGAQIYKAFLPHVEEIWLTHINTGDEELGADVFFPVDEMIGLGFKFDRLVYEHPGDEKNPPFRQVVYRKKP